MSSQIPRLGLLQLRRPILRLGLTRRSYSVQAIPLESFRGRGLSRVPRISPGVVRLDLSENHIRQVNNGDIPEGVIHLDLSFNPIGSIQGLPATIRHLDLSYCSFAAIPRLPNGVSTLYLYGVNQVKKIENLPFSVKALGIYGELIEKIEGLPPTLEELRFGELSRKIRKLENLPSTLKRLHVVWQRIQYIVNLPDGLQHLSLFQNDITTMENIPNGVESVELTGNNIRRIRAIPSSCKRLILTGEHAFGQSELDRMRETLASGKTWTLKDETKYNSLDVMITK